MIFDYQTCPPGRKTPCIWGARTKFIKQSMKRGVPVDKHMFPQIPSAGWILAYLVRKGFAKLVKRGHAGCKGVPHTYQLK